MRGFVFEMDEANQLMIEKNVEGLRDVSLVRAALGGRSGEVWRGPVHTQNTGGGGVFWDASGGAAKVAAVSIVDFMRDSGVDYIDLLKLDCEGSEFSILDALTAEPGGLRRRVGCVRAEVHATRDDARFVRLMDQLRASFPFVDVASTGTAALSMVYAWR
jgi:FkbM family methyltransferase